MGADGAERRDSEIIPIFRSVRSVETEVGLQSEVPYSSAIYFKKEDLPRSSSISVAIPKGTVGFSQEGKGLSIGWVGCSGAGK